MWASAPITHHDTIQYQLARGVSGAEPRNHNTNPKNYQVSRVEPQIIPTFNLQEKLNSFHDPTFLQALSRFSERKYH